MSLSDVFPENLGQTRKRSSGGAVFAVGVGAGVSLLLGLLALFVPWKDPLATSYSACHASPSAWLGCVGGLTPWLPFALLAGGALGLAVLAARMRR